MTNTTNAPPKEDSRPHRGGWAPGDYLNVCRKCRADFIGDKLASWCADCAYAKPDPKLQAAPTSSDTDTARLVERIRKTHREITESDGGECGMMEMFRQAADTIEALTAEVKAKHDYGVEALGMLVANDLLLKEQAARIEKLEAEIRDQNKAILELQREACARSGVPMPSERPLVDNLRDRIAKLEAALREARDYLDDMNMSPKLRKRLTHALEPNQ